MSLRVEQAQAGSFGASPVAADVTWLHSTGNLAWTGAPRVISSVRVSLLMQWSSSGNFTVGSWLLEWKLPWVRPKGASACFIFAHEASRMAHPGVRAGGAAQVATIWGCGLLRAPSPIGCHRDQALTQDEMRVGREDSVGGCGGHRLRAQATIGMRPAPKTMV